jgi:phosphatidylethanolamine/phosphatidyl-N-methylethanolamine N-methyltransferase
MDDNAPEMTLAPRLRWLTFFRQWMKNPRRMASIAPSGRQLACMMVAALPPDCRQVIELGAGTGAITAALLRHGIPPHTLLAVEMNPVLHGLLQKRFPGVHLACDDARHLEGMLDSVDAFRHGEVDAVCSSLGLLAMPPVLQHDILSAAFGVLRPGGVFIQYTYGVRSPVSSEVCRRLGLQCRAVGLAWRNLPPARVFVYQRHQSAAVMSPRSRRTSA